MVEHKGRLIACIICGVIAVILILSAGVAFESQIFPLNWVLLMIGILFGFAAISIIEL